MEFTLSLTWLSFLFILTVFTDQIVITMNRMSVVERVRIDANRLKGGAVKKRGAFNYSKAFGQDHFSLWVFVPLVPQRDLNVEQLYE